MMTDPEFAEISGHHASEESYYVSITDLLIGLLFIFIILLTFFAAQFRDKSDQIVSANQTRAELLQKMAADMERRNIEVTLDLPRGILRLSGTGLFETGERDPTDYGNEAITALADTMARHLPCYSHTADGTGPADCEQAAHTVDTVILEGHTDETRVVSAGWVRDNWDLSAARATSTYRKLVSQQPILSDLRNAPQDTATVEPLFSTAGFADKRPIASGSSDAAKAENRRIDIRVVMAPPKPAELAVIPEEGLDWRRLGEPRALNYGKRLKFARGRRTDGHLGLGWSRPESWGVWSNGPSAPLILPLKPRLQGKAIRLEVSGLAFVEAVDPVRRVRILVNGTELDSWEFTHPDNTFQRSLFIPDTLTQDTSPLIVSFEIENPASPASLGLSADGRALGIALTSVRIARP